MSASFTWLGHSTFRLVLPDKRVILIDPWLKDNPACPDALKSVSRCDMIFITHGHSDHTGDVNHLIDEFNPIVVGNFDLCNVIESQNSKGQYSPMSTGGTQTVGGVRVSLTHAVHSSSINTPDGPVYTGMPNGLIIAHDGLATIYHAGDTDVFSDMRLIAEIFEPKVCILPIGDHFTMGAKGAAIAADLLNPQQIIPCHYKSFPVLDQSAKKFQEALSPELRSRLMVPDVGQSLAWNATDLSVA